ncbi:uncharacterized protein PHACADRAFT_212818 [Phanerochaete carnosa HHB-10118-sp]|uniref:DUF6534 domain-containing protein n=1 Tax=Phanerochaete carnosa (strain HHB-10118-sp) TaxID=650164 RepID=K5WKW8_PHACS|nr:uncharacterized protein PHACADRAFT_212818 [Phanerochaete carnosa HHB-10118-sp]EKM50902.1 hypothetical protein PHACADRAFT_212818 [Phanerochaete carnosa HHB-10118-sp]
MSNSSSSPLMGPTGLNVMSSYGTQLLGSVFSTGLWGISCTQVFLYFLNYDRDSWALKIFVIYLWALGTAVEAVTWAGMFQALITNWGSLQNLLTVNTAIVHRTWLSAVVAFSAQMFFLYRIYRFTGGKGWLVRACMASAILIASCGLGSIIAYSALILSNIQSITATLSSHRIFAIAIVARSVSAFADIMIAVWMAALLSRKTGEKTFSSSNRMVYRLIIMSINSGFWTALVALIDLSLIAWNYTDLAFSICEYPLTSLYVNMILANLNVREYLRGTWQGSKVIEGTFGSTDTAPRDVAPIPLRRINRSTGISSADQGHVEIRIEKSMTLKSDADSMEAGKSQPFHP